MKTIKLEKFLLPIKYCRYRNCNKEVIGKRVDAEFCCRKHKQYEKIYLKRLKGRQES